MRQIIIMALLCFSGSVQADNTSERINGVADFLIERANDNYLYIFQKKIEENEDFKCYFPTTYGNLKLGSAVGLKGLLTSRDMWKDSIRKDLENITVRALQNEISHIVSIDINGSQLDKAASNIASEINRVIQFLQIEYQGKTYPLNVVPLAADKSTQVLINGFTDGLGTALVNMTKIEPYKKGCQAPPVDFDQFKVQTDLLFDSVKGVVQSIKHFEQNARYLRASPQGWGKVCSAMAIDESRCSDRNSTVNELKQNILEKFLTKVEAKTLGKLQTITTMTSLVENHGEKAVNNIVITAVCAELGISKLVCSDKEARQKKLEEIALLTPGKLLSEDMQKKITFAKELFQEVQAQGDDTTSKAMAALKKISVLMEGQPKEYERLSKYVLFFANVADADSSDQVKAILTNYTLPSVSFFEKRDDGNHIMVTSYLGMSYNLDEDEAAEDRNNGIFAPIGFEYSKGVDWLGGYVSSASIMVAPVDFGYPVNLKLNGIEEDIEFDEIVAPSISFSVGFTDYPLTLGVGYQKGRTIEMTSETEDRMIIFFAFDMPLYNFGGD